MDAGAQAREGATGLGLHRADRDAEDVGDLGLAEVLVVAEHDDGQRDALWEFVQTLPRKQRAVIVLRYYEDLSEAEIADVMGISTGTVKSQASRALAGLRERAPRSLDPRHTDPREEER